MATSTINNSLTGNLTFVRLTSGSLTAHAESLPNGIWLYRTNDSVTDAPAQYVMGVILVIDNNRYIFAFGMVGTSFYANRKQAASSWTGWTRNIFA